MSKTISRLAAAVAFTFAGMGAANAASITLNGSGATDVDLFAGTFHDVIAGIDGVITDVNVSVQLGPEGDNLHWGDLDMFLVHNGVSVQLLDNDDPDDCCSSDDPFDVLFDDSATDMLGSIGAVGTFKPQNGSLADFIGLSLMGTWQLQILEIECCEGETDLLSWSVIIEYDGGEVPIPAALPLFAAGLATFGFFRRKKRNAA